MLRGTINLLSLKKPSNLFRMLISLPQYGFILKKNQQWLMISAWLFKYSAVLKDEVDP